MSNYENTKDRFKNLVENRLGLLKDNIRDDFKTDPNFRNAIAERDNDENNNFIVNLILAFACPFTVQDLSSNYTNSHTQENPDIDTLLGVLKDDINAIILKYSNKMKSDIDCFVDELVLALEKSDFLTEVVENTEIDYKGAKRGMSTV